MVIRLLLISFCLCFFGTASAQSPKKAVRLYGVAQRMKAKKKPEKAYKKLEKSIKKDRKWPDPYIQLGEWYFDQHRFTDAVQVFRNAASRVPNGQQRFAKPLAKCLLYAGKADDALYLINTYANIKDSAEWNRMRRQGEFIRQAIIMQGIHWPVSLGIRINTADPELFPCMAVDTQTFYFTRRLNNMDDELYSAQYDTCGGWLSALNMGYLPNSPDAELAEFISADGHYMFFTRCDKRSEDGFAEGGCDLYMAYRVANDSDWSIAQPFGSTINTPAYEGMPSLSQDNRELYFVSDREGGMGGYDIWISKFDDGLWQAPQNAGPAINTPGNETAPYIDVDNKTFFFTSDYWPGMGGTDLFMNRKMNDTLWGRTTNLGYPINTAHDEKTACVTLDGKKLYFSSDRNGPAGNYDIYETPLPANMQPAPVSYMKGYVFDSLTNARLNYAIIEISNVATGEVLYKFHSNRGDGSYLIALHLNHTYAIKTQRMEYKTVTDTVVFDSSHLYSPLLHNICMVPSNYKYIRAINDSLIATLHFEVNHVELADSDKVMLRKALNPWIEEPNITLLVNAYTDNTGTPMINEELSQKRAAMVAAALNKLGVSVTNIEAHGWGEAKMIASNDTEEGQRINRRVEIIVRRAEIIIH
jgi:outer membrane protein OmpA-like peptidoglycan-associated protein/tetratricopeptide (TPR) repeat protein